MPLTYNVRMAVSRRLIAFSRASGCAARRRGSSPGRSGRRCAASRRCSGIPAHTRAARSGALAAGVALYEPRTLGPLLALALPLEITKLWFPFLQTRSELGGGLPPTSVVDAGRLVVALAFVVWLVRPRRPRADVAPSSPLTLPLALLFAVYALSTL